MEEKKRPGQEKESSQEKTYEKPTVESLSPLKIMRQWVDRSSELPGF